MSRLLFVNLPVEDLNRSMAFFTSLGFRFDPDMTDDTRACLMINDTACVFLMRRDLFATFHDRGTASPDAPLQALVAVVVETRREVDFICRSAFDAGATRSLAPSDQGFVYTWSFTDLDGHVWELLSLEEA